MTHTHTHTHTHTYTHTHTHTFIYTHTHTHTHIYIYIYIYVSLNNKDRFCLYNLSKILSYFLISVLVSGCNWMINFPKLSWALSDPLESIIKGCLLVYVVWKVLKVYSITKMLEMSSKSFIAIVPMNVLIQCSVYGSNKLILKLFVLNRDT